MSLKDKMSKKQAPIQYYTMATDKFMELLKNSHRDYQITSDLMKEYITKYPQENWEDEGVHDIIETFVIVRSLKFLLDNKLNDPPKEEIDFCKKNDIKDILLTEAELYAVQRYVGSIEDQRDLLKSLYKIDIFIH